MYSQDTNTIPPVFVLQRSNDEYGRVSSKIQQLLRFGAGALPPSDREKYVIAVTNDELVHGVIENKVQHIDIVCPFISLLLLKTLYFRSEICK